MSMYVGNTGNCKEVSRKEQRKTSEKDRAHQNFGNIANKMNTLYTMDEEYINSLKEQFEKNVVGIYPDPSLYVIFAERLVVARYEETAQKIIEMGLTQVPEHKRKRPAYELLVDKAKKFDLS